MFGGLRLRVEEQEFSHFRTQKTAALLAYLAYHPERAHPREVLMELLWPDCVEAAARRSLSTALWSLRQQLGTMLPGGERLLRADRAKVALSGPGLVTDVQAFLTALGEARTGRDPEGRMAPLSRAVELYQGELLHGLYEDWIFPEQTRLAALYQQALAELCTVHEAGGNLSTALEYATLAVRHDPLCQAHRYRIMRLYAASGQGSVALAHYQEFERLLRRELDATPDPELRRLAAAIAAAGPGEPLRLGSGSLENRRSWMEPGPPLSDPPAPPEASFYVIRPVDAAFQAAVEQRSSIVLLKGPRGTGKTTALVRGLGQARERGMRVVFTDLQALEEAQFASPDTFFRTLADALAEQLELETLPRTQWIEDWAPSLNLRRYLRRSLLPHADRQIVWALDGVDRLFSRPFYGDVFGLFRSWHNERASDPEGLWSRLTLVLGYSTEAHLFLPDLDQSPFNVGVRLELGDFSEAEVQYVNEGLGKPLRNPGELARFVARFGGHPYLVQRGLRELAQGRSDLGALETSYAPFRDHLRAVLLALRQDPALCAVVRLLLQGQERFPEESAERLRSAGLIVTDGRGAARFRCGLYRDYLRQHLI